MLPKLIDTGGFFLPTYGVLVAIAFLVAIWLTGKLAVKAGLEPDKITNLAIYCALGRNGGGKAPDVHLRLAHVSAASKRDFHAQHATGGRRVSGWIAAGDFGRIPLHAAQRITGVGNGRVFAPGLALGHAIGRLGCLSAGCCWGSVCHRPWAITFTNPEPMRSRECLSASPFTLRNSTSQLAELFIFGFLYRRFHRSHGDGEIIGWYLLLYSGVRFLVEFFRNHEQDLVAGLSLTQWISAATFHRGAMAGSAQNPR